MQKFELDEIRKIPAKGDLQMMPNGNAFICWSKASELSEHSPDGKVLMDAAFKLDHADTYRGYKFPWVGLPSNPPDIKSFADLSGKVNETTVYVSWNGATEVRTWNVYGTNSTEDEVRLITSGKRKGFETKLSFAGYAASIYVEGLDADDNVLGRSGSFKTIVPEVPRTWHIAISPVVTIVFALLSCTIALLVVLIGLPSTEKRPSWWPNSAARYSAVAEDEKLEEGDETLVAEDREDEKSFMFPPVK